MESESRVEVEIVKLFNWSESRKKILRLHNPGYKLHLPIREDPGDKKRPSLQFSKYKRRRS